MAKEKIPYKKTGIKDVDKQRARGNYRPDNPAGVNPDGRVGMRHYSADELESIGRALVSNEMSYSEIQATFGFSATGMQKIRQIGAGEMNIPITDKPKKLASTIQKLIDDGAAIPNPERVFGVPFRGYGFVHYTENEWKQIISNMLENPDLGTKHVMATYGVYGDVVSRFTKEVKGTKPKPRTKPNKPAPASPAPPENGTSGPRNINPHVKYEAVRRVTDKGMDPEKVAADMGVAPSSITRWASDIQQIIEECAKTKAPPPEAYTASNHMTPEQMRDMIQEQQTQIAALADAVRVQKAYYEYKEKGLI